jgi:hypothetical protein
MQDVLAKLKEIVGTYDNEDMQAAIAASQVTQTEETIDEADMMPKTLKCKECGDMLGNPTTDCPCDSQDPKGDNWIMVDVDNDGDMDMAVANEEEVAEEEAVEEDSVEEVHEEEVSESVDQDATDFERMLKLAGQSGVIGMSTNNILVTESVEVAEDEFSEEAFVAKEADDEEVDESKSEDEKRWKQTGMSPEEAIAKYGKENVKVKKGALRNGDDMVEVLVDEMVEAVGASADPIMDLCDDLGCDPDHPIFAELVRYLSGDQIKDFVADFRRHNDMNHPGEDGDYGDDDANFEEHVEESESVEEATVEVPVQELAELMKLAGYENYADQIEEYANEPAEEYSDVEDQMIGLSGGLNGPKKAYAAAAGGDNPMDQEPTDIEEDDKLTFEGMYKRYMTQVAEETLQEKQ